MPAVGVGVVAGIFVGVATGSVFAAVVIGVATAAVSQYVIKELMVPSVSSDAATNQELQVGKPIPRVVVGESVVSGAIIKYDNPEFDDKKWHIFYVCLGQHRSQSVSIYQIAGERVSDMQSNNHYIEPRLGDQTGPVQRSLDHMRNIDSSFIGYNTTDAYCEFVNDAEVYPSGVNDLKFLVKGLSVYDPRKDSTVGGDGSHRLNDESTWEWSDNPALINFWWKKFKGDVELDDDAFSMENIAFEANLCDEQVTATDSEGNQLTEARYSCNGVLNLSDGYEANEEKLLASCGGRWIESAGQWRLKVAAYRGPALFTITESHLASKPKRKPFRPLSSRINVLRGEYISKAAYYQAADMTPIRSESLINDRDAGTEYEGDLQLYFTQTDSMTQRLGVIELLRNAAGDTLNLELKRCYAELIASSVVYVDLPNHLIQGLYEIDSAQLDDKTFHYSIVATETSADMYNQLQSIPDNDVTPNFHLNTGYISPVANLTYNVTPEDSFRYGVLTWTHAAQQSVKEFVVMIKHGDTLLLRERALEPYFNVTGLSPLDGDYYTAYVYATNTFDKPSEAIAHNFNVDVPSTPVGELRVDILPGQVILTGPTLPHSAATYEWKYAYSDDFLNAFNGGLNPILTVLNTPHGATLYVWYRLVVGDNADPNWIALAVPNLIGINVEVIDVETFSAIQWGGLPATLGETIGAVLNDLSLWSQQMSEQGNDYQTLIYNVTEVVAANQVNSLDIIAIKSLVGTTSVQAQIVQNNTVQIGYENADGDWIVGAPLARSFNEIKISRGEEYLSVIEYFEALENEIGDLQGTIYLGIVDQNELFTGVEILGGSDDSDIHLYADRLKIASRAGNLFYTLDNATGQFVIESDTIIKGTLSNARKVNVREHVMEVEDIDGFGEYSELTYWKGAPILTSEGKPDFDNLSKANATFRWEDIYGATYFAQGVSSGVYNTTRTNSSLALNTSIEIGPFDTNGNRKSITCTLMWMGSSSYEDVCDAVPIQPSCTLTIERKIGNGAWLTLQTYTIADHVTQQELFEPELSAQGWICYVFESVNQSFTLTDTDTTVNETFSYRAVVSNQQRYHAPQYISTQNLTLTSFEERPS